MLRYLNMFILIGVTLVALSLIGFATHNRFLMEAGQQPSSNASLIYLVAGILMLVNGVVSIRMAPAVPLASAKSIAAENSSDGGDAVV